MDNKSFARIAVWILVAVVLFTVFRQFETNSAQPLDQTSYTQFMDDAKAGKIRKVEVQGRKILVTPQSGAEYAITSPGDLWMVDDLRKNGVQVYGKAEEEPSFLTTLFVSWFPMLLLIGVWIFFMRRMQGGAGGGGAFMRAQRARTVMSTLADQCRTFTYDQARDLVDVIMKYNLQTNMTLDDMIAAMEQALKLRTCVIEELRIPQNDAVHPISYAGMAVQEVDWVMSREDMSNFLSSGWLVIDDNDEDDPIDF